MKNKILLICLLSSHAVWGQFVLGTKMLQGNFSYNFSANGNDKNADSFFKNRYLSANIGTQITRIESETQQWGFGANLSFRNDVNEALNKNNTGSTLSDNYITGFSFGLNISQARLKKIIPNLYAGFRYQSGLEYSIENWKTINEQTNTLIQPVVTTANNSSIKRNNISITIGITSQFYYFITPRWGLSANIGNLSANLGHNFKDKNWAFNSNSSFNSFGFGLFKILRQ